MERKWSWILVAAIVVGSLGLAGTAHGGEANPEDRLSGGFHSEDDNETDPLLTVMWTTTRAPHFNVDDIRAASDFGANTIWAPSGRSAERPGVVSDSRGGIRGV